MNRQRNDDPSSLASYAARAKRMPYLSPEEEIALAESYRDSRSPDAAKRLIESHLRLVVHHARRYRSFGVPLSELVSEGHLGLMDALERFDPSRESRFSTYASFWIRAAMREHIVRSQSVVGRGSGAKRRSSIFGRNASSATFGDVSLDAPTSEGGAGWIEALADGAQDQEAELALRQMRTMIRQEVDAVRAGLSDREQTILSERLYVEDEEMSLADLGRGFGVSRERVRQIEVDLKKKLRARLEQVSAAFPQGWSMATSA